jgi:hypothetical protein
MSVVLSFLSPSIVRSRPDLHMPSENSEDAELTSHLSLSRIINASSWYHSLKPEACRRLVHIQSSNKLHDDISETYGVPMTRMDSMLRIQNFVGGWSRLFANVLQPKKVPLFTGIRNWRSPQSLFPPPPPKTTNGSDYLAKFRCFFLDLDPQRRTSTLFVNSCCRSPC